MSEGLSEYELLRQSNISRNAAILDALELSKSEILVGTPAHASKNTKSVENRNQAQSSYSESRKSMRVSTRLNLESSLPLVEPVELQLTPRRKQSVRAAVDTECEDFSHYRSMGSPPMPQFLEALCSLQENHVKVFAGPDFDGTDSAWKQLAVRKWGLMASKAVVDDWKGYVRSRCPVPITPGSDLLQEKYSHDVWQLLVSCLLMSRVSSMETKEKCIDGLFRLFPTPSSLKVASDQEIFPVISSLGLFDTRIRGLREVTDRFLFMPIFQIGLKPPLKIYGIGSFTYDSYLIFSCGQGRDIKTSDPTLKAYCEWLRKQPLLVDCS